MTARIKYDWVTIVVWLLLLALGWVNLYAAVYDESRGVFELGQRYGMQLLWIGASLLIALVVMLIDDKYYHSGGR